MAARADHFEIEEGFEDACAEAGIASVADVLAKAECIRDLPDRANLRLHLGDDLVHVKHDKRRPPRGWKAPPVMGAFLWAALHEFPAPRWVFHGVDGDLGALVGTLDLAPARPLDDLLREGGLDAADRRRIRLHLAMWVACLHMLRVHHKDLYLNHVFVDPEREDPVVAVIDWDRADEHRLAYGRWVVKDLAALLSSIPEGTVGRVERQVFLYQYLVIRAYPKRPSRRLVRRLARKVERKAERMRRHVPRTPVGDAARPKESAS